MGGRLKNFFFRPASKPKLQDAHDSAAVGMGAVNLTDEIVNFFLIIVKNRMHVAEEQNVTIPESRQPTQRNLNFGRHVP